LGDFLKKPVGIILAATGLLAMTACAPQLSTSETCVELRAVVQTMASPSPAPESLDELDKLSGRASDTLKGVIKDVAFANRERLKPVEEQDAAKLTEAQERIDAKSEMVRAACEL
jgi:hypothetical protein